MPADCCRLYRRMQVQPGLGLLLRRQDCGAQLVLLVQQVAELDSKVYRISSPKYACVSAVLVGRQVCLLPVLVFIIKMAHDPHPSSCRNRCIPGAPPRIDVYNGHAPFRRLFFQFFSPSIVAPRGCGSQRSALSPSWLNYKEVRPTTKRPNICGRPVRPPVPLCFIGLLPKNCNRV